MIEGLIDQIYFEATTIAFRFFVASFLIGAIFLRLTANRKRHNFSDSRDTIVAPIMVRGAFFFVIFKLLGRILSFLAVLIGLVGGTIQIAIFMGWLPQTLAQ